MYVIDGYNLQHALARHNVLPGDFGRARARLIELLGHLARRESTNLRIFFDGAPGQLAPGEISYPGVSVLFCGEGIESADHAVREYVENSAHPGKLRVVSSDRAVARACKLSGAKVMSAQDMADRLASLVSEGRAPRGSALEKPTRGAIGRIEREMIDDIGDLRAFEQQVLRELTDNKDLP
ncbi:MAG: NYN domain-containing protein [Planctomycetes bacterium]|nr:NYN domain-containing protein [Planctomycetota bacterium]